MGATIDIFTNRQEALDVLSSATSQTKLIWECRKILSQLALRTTQLCGGYQGIVVFQVNGKADKLAKGPQKTLYRSKTLLLSTKEPS